MIRTVLLTAAFAVGITAAMAQGDPIAQRRDTMKGVGAATRTGTQMSKGEVPFDLAKARDVLQTYANATDRMHTYFPDTAKTGGETTASPKIWENQADFRAKFDAWAKDIEKAKAETKDLTTFRANFETVTKACGSCHQTYRIQKS